MPSPTHGRESATDRQARRQKRREGDWWSCLPTAVLLASILGRSSISGCCSSSLLLPSSSCYYWPVVLVGCWLCAWLCGRPSSLFMATPHIHTHSPTRRLTSSLYIAYSFLEACLLPMPACLWPPPPVLLPLPEPVGVYCTGRQEAAHWYSTGRLPTTGRYVRTHTWAATMSGLHLRLLLVFLLLVLLVVVT